MKSDVLESPVKDVEILDNVEFEKPKNYKIILENTPNTFAMAVAQLLAVIFRKNNVESMNIMMMAHERGEALVEITSKEISEVKMQQIRDYITEEDPKKPLEGLINLNFRVEEDA